MEKNKRNQCNKPQLGSYATNASKSLFHEKVYLYLGLPLGITITDEYIYESGKKEIQIINDNINVIMTVFQQKTF